VTGHLTDEQLARFAAGAGTPEDVLAVDDHLAACAACRDRARMLQATDDRLAAVPEAVMAPVSGLEAETDPHLTDAEVQAVVDDDLADADRARIEDHLETCETCAAQVAELRAWATAPAKPTFRRYAWAAVLLLLLIPIGYWQSLRDRPPAVADPIGLAALPADAQDRVRAALRTGSVPLPAAIAALAGRRETLMGPPAPPAPFRVVGPVATAVAGDRPELTWEPLAGAGEYTVTIADDQGRPIGAGFRVRGTTFTPPEPLPRGHVFTWQVAAQEGSRQLIAPAPPAPPARFAVLDAATAARLADLERAQPDAHVVLGILYAQAGVLADARRHLQAVPAADPYAVAAGRILTSLGRPAGIRD
jgi:anti-sigma factor RsiW